MRTLLTIGTITVLLTVGSITSYQYIQTSAQELILPLATIEQSLIPQKWEAVQNELNTAQTHWDKNKKLWTILLDHQEVDNVDFGLKRLEKYVEVQDISLSLGEVSHLRLLIDHIADTARLDIRNIL